MQETEIKVQEKKTAAKRGFAAMDPAKQRAISSLGGKAVHEQGKAHCFNPEEARNAGRKGGLSVSENKEHMSEIGRRGGEASSERRRTKSIGGE